MIDNCPPQPEDKFCWVYMLKCGNGAYYTGFAKDIVRRYWRHLHGVSGAKFVSAFKPTALACCWQVYGGRGEGLKLEAFIKKHNRKYKQSLAERPAALASEAAAMGIAIQTGSVALIEEQVKAYAAKRAALGKTP